MEAQADPRPDAAKGVVEPLPATWFIGMNDPDTDPDRTRQLRDEAAARLNDTAQCDDPVQRDGPVSEAVALLAQARRLRNQAGGDARGPGGRDAEARPKSTRVQ